MRTYKALSAPEQMSLQDKLTHMQHELDTLKQDHKVQSVNYQVLMLKCKAYEEELKHSKYPHTPEIRKKYLVSDGAGWVTFYNKQKAEDYRNDTDGEIQEIAY